MKVLVVRFSSIGDIVLTSPVVRCIKQQLPNAQVHFITKHQFKSTVEHNLNIDRLFTFKSNISEIIPQLKNENYDCIIDLHRNVRSLQLKLALGKKAYSFNKLNFEKFLMVYFKFSKLPNKHIVDRYFEPAEKIGVKNDGLGLDYFITENDGINVSTFLPQSFHGGYYTLVVGGSYFTKQIPKNKLLEICSKSKLPLVLLGGKSDESIAKIIQEQFPDKTVNACGKLSLNQSASLIQQSQKVITSDTGLMHIAAAYKKTIVSLWGNTIPEFGMGPYQASENSQLLEVKNLSCRPCSKLGFKKCPKGHFKCMNDIVIPVI